MTERGALLGGRYQLDQIIGRGGMAEVWRARDLRLARDVAVKRLRIDLASDPTFQARFRREAQSAAGLNHPNIVAVYDTGEERDTNSDVSVPYIVMELVEGVTLREVLRDGRKIVPERALDFTAGVLDGLAYSHRMGIIHRDIKPANVMLTPNGTVKVMDFGIARAVADTSATMTQTAAVIGTAQYLSPEQARGEKVDNRSDIYSVGCLLYELLTSQPLFKGESPVSVAYQHVREIPVPPSQIDPEITAPMDAIVLKSLAKDPRDRYQDAGEFREDILRALNGQPVHASAQPAEQPTQVIANDPITTTARRGVVPVAAGHVASPVTSATPGEVALDEEEEPKSRKGLIALAVLAGLVLIGMIIAIIVIMNPPAVEPSVTPTPMAVVPDVVGRDQASAEQALKDAQFVPVVQTEAGTTENQGKVTRQDPENPQQHPIGGEVTIWISTGADSKAIPPGLLNVPYDTAKQILEAEGFTNVQPAVPDDPRTEDITAREGDVTKTTPAIGQQAALDAPITLTVATGQSIVPRLTGLDAQGARDEAERSGFEVGVTQVEVTDESRAGEVITQDVDAGTAAPRSRRIEITVGVYTPPATTPPPVTSTPPASPPASTPVSPPVSPPASPES